MKKFILLILYITVLLFWLLSLSGCSGQWHAKRAKKHLKKAEAKGAVIKQDTTYIEVKVPVPSDSVRTIIKELPSDTIEIVNSYSKIRYYPTPQGLGVECLCFPPDALALAPVTINKTFETPPAKCGLINFRWYHWIIAAVLAVLLLAIKLR